MRELYNIILYTFYEDFTLSLRPIITRNPITTELSFHHTQWSLTREFGGLSPSNWATSHHTFSGVSPKVNITGNSSTDPVSLNFHWS